MDSSDSRQKHENMRLVVRGMGGRLGIHLPMIGSLIKEKVGARGEGIMIRGTGRNK
jgi:hypothetical protein